MIDRSSVRWGFVLILLALLGAFFIPQASIPRLALSAHTVGLMSGLLLIVFGLKAPVECRHCGPREELESNYSHCHCCRRIEAAEGGESGRVLSHGSY